MSRERSCRTCRFDFDDGPCAIAEGEDGEDCYQPAPFWTSAERAGIKAMGRALVNRDREAYKGTMFICWAICHFVRAAKDAKEKA